MKVKWENWKFDNKFLKKSENGSGYGALRQESLKTFGEMHMLLIFKFNFENNSL